MSESNAKIDQCLDKLFDFSSNFKVSIESIQKLAQHLRFETFIDKHAYTVNPNQLYQQLKPQRLSIAGSLILVDIDFTSDNKIINLSLSLANQDMSIADGHGNDTNRRISQREDIKVINIDLNENNEMSILKKNADEEQSMAESILFSSLQGTRLGKFPNNLRYLALLDRLSTADVNLFSFINKVGLILKTVQSLEGINEDIWEIKEGLCNSVGNIISNDKEGNRIGLFIEFWKDSRFVAHEMKTQDNNSTMRRNYGALIGVDSHVGSPINYLQENKTDVWKLQSPHDELTKYQFDYESNEEHLNTSSDKDTLNSWIITLNLSSPVFIPNIVLEYHNVEFKLNEDHENDRSEATGYFSTLNSGSDLKYPVNIKESKLEINITTQLVSQFVPVRQVSLKTIHDIKNLLSLFRNFLVFENLIKSVAAVSFDDRDNDNKDQRSDIMLDELSSEMKKKLKETLKLSNNVTDEELLALNVITDTKTNMMPSLDSFMNDDTDETTSDNQLVISLDEVNLESENNDIIISISGIIAAKLKISNGQISKVVSSEDEMEVESASEKFIKGLSLTEDIPATLSYIL
ncbi:uncharacterized protein PRCAT00003869001 [Priceomyces carsonii]|uniref:uncharacterized protein n=1 Tax=Priceomyces carsonii TaxID=28549 RepID=UPI002ED8BB59|nr:unnamed protein product [Priceomyces carsonii]